MSKKNILGSVGFWVLFALLINFYLAIGTVAISKTAGVDTGTQIKQQFKDVVKQKYDCIVFGNSRIYRGVNPSLLSETTYNFAHDNDSYNQIYWKLNFLEKNEVRFDKIILGTDYFMFSFLSDTRNQYYGELLPAEYLLDYNSEVDNSVVWYDKLNEDLNVYINTRFQEPLNYIFSVLKQSVNGEESTPYLSSNGQYIVPNRKATEGDEVTRDAMRLGIQMQYFEKILTYCKEKGIEVVVVMPPTRNRELESYDEALLIECDRYLNDIVETYGVMLLNYSNDEKFKSTELYMDITHLSPKGGDLWTEQLNKDLINICFFNE